jgi:hypothetical protein
MSLRRTSLALYASISMLGILLVSWFVLNHYRVLYYNDAIEGPSPQSSPYWTIIHVQDLMLWPILVMWLWVTGLILFKIARWVERLLATRRPR